MRLDIGFLTDAIPAFHRHFEAPAVPIKEAAHDVADIERALLAIHVHDVAVRARTDSTSEASILGLGDLDCVMTVTRVEIQKLDALRNELQS